jgi:YesN/AraC family two-component response regulator
MDPKPPSTNVLTGPRALPPPRLRVLFVDDEPMILQALERALGRMRPAWEVRGAGNGEHALELLTHLPVDVVVADLHMPGMDGLALLEAVRTSHPLAMRFVVSGCEETSFHRQSANLVHRFLAKPFELRSLLDALDLAEEVYLGPRKGPLQRAAAGA